MGLLRRPIIAIADQPKVEALIRKNGMAGSMVSRFVAGETLEAALASVQDIKRQGMTTTLDQLGENVETAAEAIAAVSTYIAILDWAAAADLEPNISVKLTMLGLDSGDDVAEANMRRVLEAARRVSGFVRIDMEGSAYTDRTMKLFERLHDDFPAEVGIVIQSYLIRAREDVERMIERKARVRLVKGAYAEPETVAYQHKREVDLSYRWLMERLLTDGTYPAIATHDPALIAAAQAYSRERGIEPDRFELQMLYGVRRDEQVNLVKQGYRVRVYVPFGTEWYPYYSRRIAERPANAFFALRQVISG